MCMIDDADPVDVCSVDKFKARRVHYCCECGRVIAKGEQYERAFTARDGDVSVYKTCEECVWARQWLNDQCGGYCFECVLQDLHDHFHDRYKTEPIDWDLVRRINGIENRWSGKRLERAKAYAAAHPKVHA